MADVSKVTTPNGNEYDIKDVKARGVDLTSAEYWALVNADEDDPDTNYHLTDAPSVSITPELISNIASILYPVGSIYMSTSDVNPGTYIPNTTWVAWGSGRVPVGVSTDAEFNTVEKTGGEKTHTLVKNELPNIKGEVKLSWTDASGGGTIWPNGYATGDFKSKHTDPALYQPGATSSTSANHHNVLYMDIGTNTPHNNIQPYITCYMWKRTA